MNVKLFIATPAFDGKVNVQYAIALAETVALLQKNHIQIEYRIVTSGSLLCAERNRLVSAFMKSDCTHMLCIDSDIGWPAAAVIGLLSRQVDFIAGCYPARGEKSFLFRPTKKEDESLVVDAPKGLISMQYIPAGFMLLSRNAIQSMYDKHSHLKFTPKDPSQVEGYALFNTELYEGEFWGEDFVFCRNARNAGIEIWVDPMIQFDHAGNIGMLAEVLTDKPIEEQKKET